MLENTLQIVVVVFMLFLCALCLFAVVVIARDIVRESAKDRREREKEDRLERMEIAEKLRLNAAKDDVKTASEKEVEISDAKEEKNDPQVQPSRPIAAEETVTLKEAETAPEIETVDAIETEIAATLEASDALSEDVTVQVESPEEDDDPDAVSFNRVNLTMEEKYGTLSSEFKRYFDEIIRHALSKDGVKESKRSASYDYKIGAYKVLRLTIKRGEIVCSFNFIDRDFNSYASESNIKIKQSATVVRVLEASAVGVVKDGINLVCQQIAEDKDRKRALANEKRREKRRLQKERQSAEA